MSALMPAELAWYVTGRFYKAADGTLADYGYFLHLPFPGVPLFAGEGHAAPSETTAHFTFAAQPFRAGAATNGALSLGLDPVGGFALFLQRRPAATFDDPATFACGECIATFRRTSLVVGTTVAAGSPAAGSPGVVSPAAETPLLATNVFSARLTASVPFDFAGGRHDLAAHIGAGVTQFGTAAATPVTPAPAGYTLAVPFTGSALALG
ncbi:hypothetical protein [Nitrospirillum sp. BR 11828]|uniref:hypothetical protein n=1 Tax=Nitrospirillum sp. BR 11828 TaxID=3104325 RepID=UPI002ACA2FFE|nr:hypothetical protein [Nitrospirillum sp. BR 11828]MDZ5648071.1 hypothetical protein [Nitrospirillum sp. BR 11828]